MADTPLHEHPAVVHLLASEFCPKKRIGIFQTEMTLTNDNGEWAWGFVSRVTRLPTTEPCSVALAHSLITLAAVRGMWAKGWTPFVKERRSDGVVMRAAMIDGLSERPALVGWHHDDFFAPTEPLAILAAYQATVMEGGK